MGTFLLVGVVMIAILVWYAIVDEKEKVDAMSPEERRAYHEENLRTAEALQKARTNSEHGPINSAMICPHCTAKGTVRTKAADRKRGISGGKATAAVLTGGVSLLATGLSHKENVTRARCDNCLNGWDF
jgi:hypothetical protein